MKKLYLLVSVQQTYPSPPLPVGHCLLEELSVGHGVRYILPSNRQLLQHIDSITSFGLHKNPHLMIVLDLCVENENQLLLIISNDCCNILHCIYAIALLLGY